MMIILVCSRQYSVAHTIPDIFVQILEKCDIVTTPGSGFGPAGEGLVRASAFGHRENIVEAIRRLKTAFSK